MPNHLRAVKNMLLLRGLGEILLTLFHKHLVPLGLGQKQLFKIPELLQEESLR